MVFINSPLFTSRRDFLEKASLIVLIYGGAIFHWFNLSIRGFERSGDLTEVWIPFAECVVSGGQMYLCKGDNKPPLFHFLNVSFAATDFQLLLFFLTMALANVVAAFLVWELCRRWGYERIGFASALIFAALMAAMTSRVNPRHYAMLFLLVALLSRTPIRAGVSIAVAGLFSQFAVFAIPAIVYLNIDIRDIEWSWVGQFIGSGLTVVAISFGLVAAVWGVEASVAGFEDSFIESGEYVAGYNERGLSLYGAPVAWVYKLYRLLDDYLWLVIGATIGSYATLAHNSKEKFGKALVLTALLTSVPFTIRPAGVYVVLVAPFYVVLFTVGIQVLLESKNGLDPGG
jgi:hypothetical protein